MPTPDHTRALVTGASSGIGRAIATRLAADGTDLVVVARRREALQALADELAEANGVEVDVVVADLCDPDDLQRVADRLAADPPIDLLVNNAGFGNGGVFADLDLDRELAQVQIHVQAVMVLTRAAVRAMRERPRGPGGRRGAILNVSSMAGFQPIPTNATYAACKAFETSFTESIRLEHLPDGIHVTALCPGFVDTPMVSGDAMLSRLPTRALLRPDHVARAGLEGVLANRAVVVPGMAWKAAAALTDSMPRSATRLLMSGFRRLQ